MEQAKRNSKFVAVSIWCIGAILLLGVILRAIELAGGQFIGIASIKITPQLVWQIPVIPRAVDVIFTGLIWAAAIALIKDQKDNELGSYGILCFVIGFGAALMDSKSSYENSSILTAVALGIGVAASAIVLFCFVRWLHNGKLPKASVYIFAAIGFILGTSLIYSIILGVIFGIILMFVSAAVAVTLIAFTTAILRILMPGKTPIIEKPA